MYLAVCKACELVIGYLHTNYANQFNGVFSGGFAVGGTNAAFASL